MTILIPYLAKFFLLSLCLGTYAHTIPARSSRFSKKDAIVTLNADQALASLLVQNEAWAQNMDKERPGFFNESAKAQNPKVLWLGCSDSRVPESVITNSLPGDIFVQRNIANQIPTADPNSLAVIAYAIEHLKVDRIVVAGHTHCGGVQYCYDAAAALPTPAPNPLPPLADPVLNTWLSDLYSLAVNLLDPRSGFSDSKDPDAAIAQLTVENVKMQVENMAQLDVVKSAWKDGRDLRIVGWLHQLENGRLKDLGICAGPLGAIGCGL